MNNMRRARLRADKSQMELMSETGIHFSTISRIEKSWIVPSEQQKKKLAKALGLSVKKLFPALSKRP